jgi:hypothetical protein
MENAVEMGSGAMIYVTKFRKKKTSSGVEKLRVKRYIYIKVIS